MKKLTLIACLSAFVAGGFMVQAVDAKVISDLKAKIEQAKKENKPTYALDSRLAVYQTEGIDSYEKILAIVSPIVKKAGRDDKYANALSVGIACRYKNLINKALLDKAIETKSVSHALRIMSKLNTGMDIATQKKYYDQIFEIANINSYRDGYFVKAIEYYIRLVNKADESEAKASLKKLNRMFTPFLVKQRKEWEPILAQIRTALDTY